MTMATVGSCIGREVNEVPDDEVRVKVRTVCKVRPSIVLPSFVRVSGW